MKEQESKTMLKDAVKKIKQLMAEEKWQEAHRACMEVLRFDPDNIKFIRLKNQIENHVKKINIKAIKEDLKQLKPLWDEKKYEELLSHFKELEPYIKDYPPLKKIILKAQNEYKKEIEKEQKQYFEDELNRIKQLLSNKKYQEAIRSAEKLRILKLKESEVKDLLSKIRSIWIENELKQHATLLKSNKYEDILLFLHKQQKIYPTYEPLKKMIAATKKKQHEYYLDQKRDYIFIGIEKTRTMLQRKKYEQAVQAAKEILDIDPDNIQAKRLFLEASKKEAKQIGKELLKQMKENSKRLKEEYKKNRKNFHRI